MTTRSALQRLLLVGIPVLIAGCLGARRPSPPKAAPRRDSTSAPLGVDSAKRPLDTTRAPVAPTPAAKDSAARVDSAKKVVADSVAKKDGSAKKVAAKKPAPTTKECLLDFTESPADNRLRYQSLPDGTSLTFIGGGFVGHCQGEKNQIRADSAEQFQGSGVINMFGNVTYEEPGKIRINALRATYFTREQRLNADGGVVAEQLATGSTFRGPNIEYLRAIPGTRPFSRLIAPNRPTVEIIEKDSTGKPGPPIAISANTIVDEGDSLMYAWGGVMISRTTILAEADSASFDKLTEKSRLIRTARVTNRDKAEPFRLSGDTIDMYSKERKLERVIARHNGNASNNDVVMQAELIDLRFDAQKLSRAFAWGPGRAKATTSTQVLVADSISVRMPDQRIRQFQAVGHAVATGLPDTTKIKSDDRDVLRGDTVTAWFDSTARSASDTAKAGKITEIHASGSASSLFQIASKEGPKGLPSLNYVRGNLIFVVFDSGQVRFVRVDSAASGMFLEPAPDSLSDSTKQKVSGAVKAKAPPAPPGRKPPADSDRIDPILLPESRRRS